MNSPIEATILTVDDDPVNRKIIEKVLKQNGYRVVEADSGRKTIEVLHEIRPDLILLDVMMPGMDGYELCAKLQENADTADIPVVFITALGEKRDRAQGLLWAPSIMSRSRFTPRRWRSWWRRRCKPASAGRSCASTAAQGDQQGWCPPISSNLSDFYLNNAI